MSLALKVILALPTFLAVIVNVAAPLAFVATLDGDTDTRFLPVALIVAVTVSPSTAQSSQPATVTSTFPLVFLASFRLEGNTLR